MTPDQKIGNYVLLEKLGAGGIGEVWKARDRRLNRVVALKFLSIERAGSTAAQDLMREARAASALNHPNIVTVRELAGKGDPRTVGAQLGVDAVLAGTVRSCGSRFKIYLELVSTRTGFQVWTETSTAETDDPLAADVQIGTHCRRNV